VVCFGCSTYDNDIEFMLLLVIRCVAV
jgi:hypothetical protein